MRLEITEPKGIDSLRLIERPTPKPGPGEVLVRVRATSLNYRDAAMIKGRPAPMKLPLIPLSDGAGDVVETGPGTTTLKKGDRVAAIFTQCWLAGPPIAGNRAMAVNQVHPVIDKVFPFEQAREAYRHLESGAHFGKVCIAM